MATFLALLVVMAAVGLLLRAFVVDAFAQTATTGPDVRVDGPTSRPGAHGRPAQHGRTPSGGHRLRPDALVWNAIDDLQVRRLLSGSPDSH